MAHARRKFFELATSSKSPVAEQTLASIGQLYEIEREVRGLDAEARSLIRQAKARPVADALHEWMLLTRLKITDGTATAKALDDGHLPIDNNWIENQIRPIALGRSNWLFAGSLRAGKRAAVVMSLIQSARMNGHDPYAYLNDVLTRLPTHKASQAGELLPHRWKAAVPVA